MRTRRQKTRGATLIELMGSVAIFMIGATALMGIYLQSITASHRTGLFYTSYNLAKNHLETLKSINFNDLPLAAENSTIINDDGIPDLSGQFVRSTTINANYTGDTTLTQVTVAVNYKLQGLLSSTPVQMTTVLFQS